MAKVRCIVTFRFHWPEGSDGRDTEVAVELLVEKEENDAKALIEEARKKFLERLERKIDYMAITHLPSYFII